MTFSKEKIEELKKVHGEIFQGVIKYKNEDGELKSIEFIHGKPSFEDYESFQNDVMKQGSAVANQNLMTGLVLAPEPIEIAKQIGDCPIATDQWIMKNVLPFLGGDVVEVSSKKL